jgi:hypothetical protein
MNFEDEEIQRLINLGALEFVGVELETGEPLYRPTDILKSIDPDLSKEMSIYFSQTTMRLWEKGFLNMDVTLKDPSVTLAEKSFNAELIDSLPKEEKTIMQEIIRVLSEKK